MSSIKERLISSVEARPENQLQEAIGILQKLQNDFKDEEAREHLMTCLDCQSIIGNLSHINGDGSTQQLLYNISLGSCAG